MAIKKKATKVNISKEGKTKISTPQKIQSKQAMKPKKAGVSKENVSATKKATARDAKIVAKNENKKAIASSVDKVLPLVSNKKGKLSSIQVNVSKAVTKAAEKKVEAKKTATKAESVKKPVQAKKTPSKPSTPVKNTAPEKKSPSKSSVPPAKAATSTKKTLVKDEPKAKAPLKGEPKAKAPAKDAPKSKAPVKDASKAKAPVKAEPKAKAPAKAEPKVKAPAKAEPKAKAPVKAEPKAKAPAKAEPKAKAPAKEEPKAKAPAKEEPKGKAPVKAEPKAKAPVKDEPKAKAPVKDAPKSKAPAKAEPKAKAPAKAEPKAKAPVKAEPKAKAPAKDEPKAKAPIKNAPKSTKGSGTKESNTEAVIEKPVEAEKVPVNLVLPPIVTPPPEPASPISKIVPHKLTKSETRELRKMLEDLRKSKIQIVETLQRQSLERHDEVNQIEDGSDANIRETDLRQATHIENEIRAIEGALRALSEGTYGICPCGRRIRFERLKANPYAALCIECATKRDHGSNH